MLFRMQKVDIIALERSWVILDIQESNKQLRKGGICYTITETYVRNGGTI